MKAHHSPDPTGACPEQGIPESVRERQRHVTCPRHRTVSLRLNGMVFWLCVFLAGFSPPGPAQTSEPERIGAPLLYQNPLVLRLPGDRLGESCPDRAIIRSNDPNDPYWYLYGTTDPLNDSDRDQKGNLILHLITCFRSLDHRRGHQPHAVRPLDR